MLIFPHTIMEKSIFQLQKYHLIAQHTSSKTHWLTGIYLRIWLEISSDSKIGLSQDWSGPLLVVRNQMAAR